MISQNNEARRGDSARQGGDPPMTASERIELIEMAMDGVTPGRWEVWEEQTPTKAEAIAEMAYQVENSDPFVEVVYLLNADGKCPATTGCGPTSAANAAYISACSPDRMRLILAEARKAEAMKREIAELRKLLAGDHEVKPLSEERLDEILEFEEQFKMLGGAGDTASLDWATQRALIDEAVLARRARTLLNGGSDAQG